MSLGPGPGQAGCVRVPAQLGDRADIACCRPSCHRRKAGCGDGMSPGHLLGSVTFSEVRKHLVYVVLWFGPRWPIGVREAVEVCVPHGFLRACDAEDQLSGY